MWMGLVTACKAAGNAAQAAMPAFHRVFRAGKMLSQHVLHLLVDICRLLRPAGGIASELARALAKKCYGVAQQSWHSTQRYVHAAWQWLMQSTRSCWHLWNVVVDSAWQSGEAGCREVMCTAAAVGRTCKLAWQKLCANMLNPLGRELRAAASGALLCQTSPYKLTSSVAAVCQHKQVFCHDFL